MAPNRTACRSSEPGAADRLGWTQLCGNGIHRNHTVGEAAQQAPDALEIGGRRGDDVHPAVRVVHPVHRDFVDPQAAALGQHQQFGVEEPPGVGDVGQQLPGDIGADRLESALRIGEARRECGFQDQVVTAGDESRAWRRAPRGSRVPVASRSRGPSGRRQGAPPKGPARRDRWTGRRPCTPAPERPRSTTRRAAPGPALSPGPAPPERRSARPPARLRCVGCRRRWRCRRW